MRPHAFTFLSGASLVLCVWTAAFWIASERREWRDGSLQVAGPIRFAAAHGTLALFNQSQPFFNGTVAIASATSPSARPKELSLQFPGFSFRHFTWPGNFPGGRCWTLGIAFLYPLATTAILPAAWCISRLRRRDDPELCPTCSYNLTGNTSGVCPECGTPTRKGKA